MLMTLDHFYGGAGELFHSTASRKHSFWSHAFKICQQMPKHYMASCSTA